MSSTIPSAADELWNLADEYLADANDPDATDEQREYARSLYTKAVTDAKAAEDAEFYLCIHCGVELEHSGDQTCEDCAGDDEDEDED